MTLDDIRARDAEAMAAAESGGVFGGGNLLLAPADRHALLAEVDRLTLTVLPKAIAHACLACREGGMKDERTRIAGEVRELEDVRHGPPWLDDDQIERAAVLAIVEGDQK